MYAQFFGSYLLSRKAVTSKQLAEAMSHLSEAKIKLGTLAMHKGYMTASEVDEVCYIQTREDKRFGEIAIDREYLTEAQVQELLKSQSPDYLLLGQNLVDMGALTNSDLEKLLIDYQADTEIDDLSVDNNEHTEKMIRKFFLIAERPLEKHALMYVNLLFNNLVRFIGDDFTPIPPVNIEEYPENFCVSQRITGPVQCLSRIDMSEDAAVQFASRYAKMDFDTFDDYVKAAIEDFLNLHNGLYSVNMSNEFSMELTLEPPVTAANDIIEIDQDTVVLPVIYPFGTIHLILTI